MNKQVLISFKGCQEDDQDKDNFEFLTEGKFYKKGEHFYISYAESELTGMKGTTTTLKVDKQNSVITMMRFGENSTHLVFEQGKTHTCCYETGVGALTVGVSSGYVDIDIDERGGKLAAKYTIDINNSMLSTNNFLITVTERNAQKNEYK